MPEILSRPPKPKRKKLVDAQCVGCKCIIRFFRDDRYWTEHGNTYGHCPSCKTTMFLGRLGLEDSY